MALSPLKATRSIPSRGESFGKSFQLYSLISLMTGFMTGFLIAALITQLPVDDLPERLAVQVAPQVVDEQARDELVALRMRAAKVRQNDDPVRGPERMRGG